MHRRSCLLPWLLAALLLTQHGFALASAPSPQAAAFDALLKRLQGTELWAEPSQDAVLRRLAELERLVPPGDPLRDEPVACRPSALAGSYARFSISSRNCPNR